MVEYSKFKQQWSTFQSISTKQTTPSHFKSLNTKKTATYADGNPGPGLEWAQKWGNEKIYHDQKYLVVTRRSKFPFHFVMLR